MNRRVHILLTSERVASMRLDRFDFESLQNADMGIVVNPHLLEARVLKARWEYTSDLVVDVENRVLPSQWFLHNPANPEQEVRLERDGAVVSIWLPAPAEGVAQAMLALGQAGFEFDRQQEDDVARDEIFRELRERHEHDSRADREDMQTRLLMRLAESQGRLERLVHDVLRGLEAVLATEADLQGAVDALVSLAKQTAAGIQTLEDTIAQLPVDQPVTQEQLDGLVGQLSGVRSTLETSVASLPVSTTPPETEPEPGGGDEQPPAEEPPAGDGGDQTTAPPAGDGGVAGDEPPAEEPPAGDGAEPTGEEPPPTI